MTALDAVALALGLGVIVAFARFMGLPARQSDPGTRWDERVAAGFVGLLPVGVLWTAQVVATLAATLSAGGIWPGWLWIWLLLASGIGSSPPAAALARRVARTPVVDLDRAAAAVGLASDAAWADTGSGAGWDLRRTPPLPRDWPPLPYGAPVWFCFAERATGAVGTEVAGPWARITLGADGTSAPILERLADAVEPIGLRSGPLERVADRRDPTQAELIAAVRRGDPEGLLVRTLESWQTRNVLIAAQPTVSAHLPPVA